MSKNENTLNVVFMGTPDFAVPALEAIIAAGHSVSCVYTQPPRPKGRGHQVQISPVHAAANRHGIEVRTPKSLKKPEEQAAFAALKADVAVVAAYGLILPQAVLDAPRFGCLNIHASLLPRWRGASPIQHAIWLGDTESGVTIMQMEAGLDTGPMIEKSRIALTDTMTASTLHDALAAQGGSLIVPVLDRLARGEALNATPQDDSLSCYAPLLTRDHGRVDWTQSAAQIDRQIRALTPWPGVWTTVEHEDNKFKILAAEPVDVKPSGQPGLLIERSGLVVCGNDSALRILKLQPPGKTAMDVNSAINGGYIAADCLFG